MIFKKCIHKTYAVTLYQDGYKCFPTKITDIEAKNKREAIKIAKDFLAKNAYWGANETSIKYKEKMKRLTVVCVSVHKIHKIKYVGERNVI